MYSVQMADSLIFNTRTEKFKTIITLEKLGCLTSKSASSLINTNTTHIFSQIYTKNFCSDMPHRALIFLITFDFATSSLFLEITSKTVVEVMFMHLKCVKN